MVHIAPYPPLITRCADIAVISQIGPPPDTFLKANIAGLGGTHAVSVTEAAKLLARTRAPKLQHAPVANETRPRAREYLSLVAEGVSRNPSDSREFATFGLLAR